MLEPAVLNGTLELWLQKKILETGGVDSDVTLLAVGTFLLFLALSDVLILIIEELSVIVGCVSGLMSDALVRVSAR
jgi:hypothetical protein